MESNHNLSSFFMYPSIINLSNEKILKKCHYDDDCVITEKIHGANFSFLCDGQNILCAKRSGLLNSDEKFHNWKEQLEKYSDKITKIFSIISESKKEIKKIIVYGEIFGGLYPHANVEKIKGIKHVQKEIFYCPDINFCAFDIWVNNIGFLDYDEIEKIFQSVDLFYTKPIAKGHIKDLINFDVEIFNSTISSYYNLPQIDNNIAEGIVIRSSKGRHVFLKKKSNKFSEIIHSNTKNKYNNRKKKYIITNTNETLATKSLEYYNDFIDYINENRLVSILSKDSELENINDLQKKKLAGSLAQDALHDFTLDQQNFVLLDKDEQKKIKKLIFEQSLNIVDQYFKNL